MGVIRRMAVRRKNCEVCNSITYEKIETSVIYDT